ncbi:MAG: hypothetical protein NZ898_17245, partial [Myxococcota bacterium]|nr:hypothetical protein [Myxococcota bacterium]MDW8364154.1 hypothetical protein [Myxococcales bacterium]
GAFEHRPEDFGLDAAAEPLFAALAALFARIGVTPTASEMRLLLADLLERARAVPQIRQAIFGRVEGVPWEALLARELEEPLEQLRTSLFRLLGAEEIRI